MLYVENREMEVGHPSELWKVIFHSAGSSGYSLLLGSILHHHTKNSKSTRTCPQGLSH